MIRPLFLLFALIAAPTGFAGETLAPADGGNLQVRLERAQNYPQGRKVYRDGKKARNDALREERKEGRQRYREALKRQRKAMRAYHRDGLEAYVKELQDGTR